MGSLYDGHIAQTGDRLTADEVQAFRDTARRAQSTASVDGMTFETMHGGTHVLLDDTIRNPDHINDWFLGKIVDRPEAAEGQPEVFSVLHGAMYYVAEVIDDSVGADHIVLTELQPQLDQWLLGFPDTVIGGGHTRTRSRPKSRGETIRDRQKRVTGSARFVVATNLAEISVHSHLSDAEGNPAPEPDSASLPVGTIVKVFMGRSLDGRPRYYFSSGGGGAVAQQFRIMIIRDEYLLCKMWDGEHEGAHAIVYRPWTLRVSEETYTFRDRTYEYIGPQDRKVTLSTGDYENQVVIPPYHAEPDGDILYATLRPRGGIASHFPGDEYRNTNGRWLDDNRDGRAWARRWL